MARNQYAFFSKQIPNPFNKRNFEQECLEKNLFLPKNNVSGPVRCTEGTPKFFDLANYPKES